MNAQSPRGGWIEYSVNLVMASLCIKYIFEFKNHETNNILYTFFELKFFNLQSWNDTRLRWEPAEYNNTDAVQVALTVVHKNMFSLYFGTCL
jgi:hypothetical protein